MGEPALAIWRSSLPRWIVKRRVHQNAGHRFGPEPGGGECSRRRRNVEQDRGHSCREPVELRVLGCKRSESRIDFDQHNLRAVDPLRERQSRRAHARAEVDHAFPCPRWTSCRQ